MAQKKKKNEKADRPEKAEKADRPEKAEKAEKAADSPIERAFAAGNYSEVRALAATDTSPRAQELLALTRVDRGQLIVGLAALLVVLIVAMFTLR